MLRPTTSFQDTSPQSPSDDGKSVKGISQMRDDRSVYSTVSEGELRGVPRREKGSPACLSSLQLGVFERNLGLSRNCKGDIFQNTGLPPRSLDISRSGNSLPACGSCQLLSSDKTDYAGNEQEVTSKSTMDYQEEDLYLLKLDQGENCNDLFHEESMCFPEPQNSESLKETDNGHPADQSQVDEDTQLQARQPSQKCDGLCHQQSLNIHLLNLDHARTNSPSDCNDLSSQPEFPSSEFRDIFLTIRSPTFEDKDKSYSKCLGNTQMSHIPADVADLRILDPACHSEIRELDGMFPEQSSTRNVVGESLLESCFCDARSDNTKTGWVRLVQQKFTQGKQSTLSHTDSDGCHSRNHAGSGYFCRPKKLHMETKPYRQWQRVSQVVTAESRYIISPEAYTGVSSSLNVRRASWSDQRGQSAELEQSFQSECDSETKALLGPAETSSLIQDDVQDGAALETVGKGDSDPKNPDKISVCCASSPLHLLTDDVDNDGEFCQCQNLAINLSTPTFDDNVYLPENHRENLNAEEIPIEDGTDSIVLPQTSVGPALENVSAAEAPDSFQAGREGHIQSSGKPSFECALSPETVRHAFASPHLFCPISPPGFSISCERNSDSGEQGGAFYDASVSTSGGQEPQAWGDGNVPDGPACLDMTGQSANGSSGVSLAFSKFDFPIITTSESSGVAFPDEVYRNNGWMLKDREDPSSSFDHSNISPSACLSAVVMASLNDANNEETSTTFLRPGEVTVGHAPCMNASEPSTDEIVSSPSLDPAFGSYITAEILGVSPTGQEFTCAAPETHSGVSDVLSEANEADTGDVTSQCPSAAINDVDAVTNEGDRAELRCHSRPVVSLKIVTSVVTACFRLLRNIRRRRSSAAPQSGSSERLDLGELEFAEAGNNPDPPPVCVKGDLVSPISPEIDDSEVSSDANSRSREICCCDENVQEDKSELVSNKDMDLIEDVCVIFEDDYSNLAVGIEDDTCCSEISTTFDDLVEGNCQLDLAVDDVCLLPAVESTFTPSEYIKEDNSKMSRSSESSEQSISKTAFSHPLTPSRPAATLNTRYKSPSSGQGSSMTASSTQLSNSVNSLKNVHAHNALRRKNPNTTYDVCRRDAKAEDMNNIKPLKTVSGVSEVSGPPVKSNNFSYGRVTPGLSKSAYSSVGRAPKLRTAARCRIASIMDTHTSSSGITSETFSLESDHKNAGISRIRNISMRADSKIKNSDRPGKLAVAKAHQPLSRLHRGSTSEFETSRKSKSTRPASKIVPNNSNTPKDRWKGYQSSFTLPVSNPPKVPVLHQGDNKCPEKTGGTYPRVHSNKCTEKANGTHLRVQSNKCPEKAGGNLRVQSNKCPEKTDGTTRVQSSGQVRKAAGGQVITECPGNLSGQRGFSKCQVKQKKANMTGTPARNSIISSCCDRWKMKSKGPLPVIVKNVVPEPEKHKDNPKTSPEKEKHKDNGKTSLDQEKHNNYTEPSRGLENLKDNIEPSRSLENLKDNIEPSRSLENLKEITEPSNGLENLKDIIEPSQGLANLKEITEPSRGLENLKDNTETSRSLENLKDNTETSRSLENLKNTEPSRGQENLKEITEPSQGLENIKVNTKPTLSVSRVQC